MVEAISTWLPRYCEDVAAIARNRCIELVIHTCAVSKNPDDWIIDPVEAISTVPLRETGVSNLASIISTRIPCNVKVTYSTHPDNPFLLNNEVRVVPTLVISTVPLNVVTSKTLLAVQTTVGVFFHNPDISSNIFPFPTSPAIIATLRAHRPTLGTGSLSSVHIRYAVTEIFARERRRVPSTANRRKTTLSDTTSLSTARDFR